MTVIQPWADLILSGAKSIETRSWSTTYRGLLAIHASKNLSQDSWDLIRWLRENTDIRIDSKRRGAILGIVDLLDVAEIDRRFRDRQTELERRFGDFTPGRFAWILSAPTAYDRPIPALGRLRLWDTETGESQP